MSMFISDGYVDVVFCFLYCPSTSDVGSYTRGAWQEGAAHQLGQARARRKKGSTSEHVISQEVRAVPYRRCRRLFSSRTSRSIYRKKKVVPPMSVTSEAQHGAAAQQLGHVVGATLRQLPLSTCFALRPVEMLPTEDRQANRHRFRLLADA